MPRFFDQPAVDSYSAFYRLPLGPAAALRDTYDRLPVDFGYDQVTHQFHLPPPLGVPALTIYASRSTIEIPTRYGPLSVLTNEALSERQPAIGRARDLTFTEIRGRTAPAPLRALAGFESSVSFGLDYKAYIGQTFDTNLTYFSIYGSNGFGKSNPGHQQNRPTRDHPGGGLQYLPISLAWSGARPDAGGSTSFNLEE